MNYIPAIKFRETVTPSSEAEKTLDLLLEGTSVKRGYIYVSGHRIIESAEYPQAQGAIEEAYNRIGKFATKIFHLGGEINIFPYGEEGEKTRVELSIQRGEQEEFNKMARAIECIPTFDNRQPPLTNYAYFTIATASLTRDPGKKREVRDQFMWAPRNSSTPFFVKKPEIHELHFPYPVDSRNWHTRT